LKAAEEKISRWRRLQVLVVRFSGSFGGEIECEESGGGADEQSACQIDPATVAQHVGLLLPIEITEIGAGSAAKTVLSIITELEKEWVEAYMGERITRERVTEFNPQTRAVEVVEREVFDGLVIDESRPRDAEPSVAAPILAEQIISGALKLES